MRRHYASTLLLAFLIIIFFHDICFFGKTLSTASLIPGTTPNGPYNFSGHRPSLPFSFDTGGDAWVNEPNPYIIRRALSEGALPVWNPREGLGSPLIANLNTEVFNPLKILLNVFPGPFLQDIFFLLRLFVMGLFTYLFLKELKLSRAASFLGASSFMLSGYSVWWINLHPLSTVMYLPAVFYFYERWSEEKDRKSPFLMSLFLSFALAAGKIPDVIMGLSLLFLYALWKGGTVTPPPIPPLKPGEGGGSYEGEGNSIATGKRGLSRWVVLAMFKEGGRVILVVFSAILMSSVVLLPFIELYAHASPLAKAIRTGAASHAIPLVTSVSLFQPLFLGWDNYFYASWLKWTPDIILPHAGIVVTTLSIYAILHRRILKKTFPYLLFSLFIFSMVYGILPTHVISRLPVLGSIEFLKYNAMFYFSLSVMSAFAFDDLLSAGGNRRKFDLSIAIVSLIIISYFCYLYPQSPQEIRGYMTIVLVLSLLGMVAAGLVSHLSGKRTVFGISVFALLVLELFLYMPKDHPDRTDPYTEPPYLKVITGNYPYRITGGGSSVPPLVSDAIGLYDVRDISVLLPGDYYDSFENLLSFSVPQTNNPNPLFSATSPFIDLMGVKYILSRELLDHWRLEDVIRSHIASLRWIRFFDAMVAHTIKGGASYGFFNANGEERFSFFFPMKFVFETRLKMSEPFIFAGFALKDVPNDTTAKVRITVEKRVTEFVAKNGGWNDRWLDLTPYMGKAVTVTVEGEGSGGGNIALGDFGLSPGYRKENTLYDGLLALHKRELDSLKYKGSYEGIHIYENTNVMDRAFVLHHADVTGGPDDVIRELQGGINFREVGLVDADGYKKMKASGLFSENESNLPVLPPNGPASEKVSIKKYTADEISLEVESKGGLLVLSDLYYPGWRVKINGRDESVLKVFGLLRGVPIKSGRSDVVFTYRPVSLYIGIIISAVTFVLWISYLYFRKRKK